jgi:predicted nucleic acid-binding protein
MLRGYPFLETTRAAYDLAAELLAAHPRLGAGDAIIATTAITSNAELWTADHDFTELTPAGLRLYR